MMVNWGSSASSTPRTGVGFQYMTTSLTVYPSAIVISNLKYSDKWNNVLKTRIKKLFVFSHRILWYVNYLSIINKIYIYIERYLGLSRTLGLEISISISRLKKHVIFIHRILWCVTYIRITNEIYISNERNLWVIPNIRSLDPETFIFITRTIV